MVTKQSYQDKEVINSFDSQLSKMKTLFRKLSSEKSEHLASPLSKTVFECIQIPKNSYFRQNELKWVKQSQQFKRVQRRFIKLILLTKLYSSFKVRNPDTVTLHHADRIETGDSAAPRSLLGKITLLRESATESSVSKRGALLPVSIQITVMQCYQTPHLLLKYSKLIIYFRIDRRSK